MNPQDGPADMSQIQNQPGDEPGDNTVAPGVTPQHSSGLGGRPALLNIAPVGAEDSILKRKSG